MVSSGNSSNPLFIRADAGGKLGTGHVMRMLALAQAYRRRGGKVDFICAQLPGALETRLQEEGCEVIRISVEPGSATDAEQTLAEVQSAQSMEHGAGGQKDSPSTILAKRCLARGGRLPFRLRLPKADQGIRTALALCR